MDSSELCVHCRLCSYLLTVSPHCSWVHVKAEDPLSHNCYCLECHTWPYWFTPPPPTEIDWFILMVLQGRIAKKTILLVFINNFYDWLFGIPFQPVIYCQNIWNILTLFFTLSSSHNYKHFCEVKQNNALCGDHISVLMPVTSISY